MQRQSCLSKVCLKCLQNNEGFGYGYMKRQMEIQSLSSKLCLHFELHAFICDTPYVSAVKPSLCCSVGDHGVCAEALYDYTAAEEDEVSFNPGDIISEIEQIDEGWWTGVTSDGHRGLFPSNYVRLI